MPIRVPNRGVSVRQLGRPYTTAIRSLTTFAVHVLTGEGTPVCGTPLVGRIREAIYITKKSLCHRCRRVLKAAGIIA